MANSSIFITELKNGSAIDIPNEVVRGLNLQPGDKVEVFIKRIRSRRLDIKISRNPLVKILDIKP
ncbi:MAG TPA: hypothetical protein ENJ10_06575 [Caldithrix abyssi]|uniref:AbrB/MazE/SpoVT family DNA-binding domain-containing protein n=1 Tax=Caldithrix abyssi TaxID=187145 RepID=A0A7V1PUC4_CALAY|nr:hypothetical protein [Caldithrix abyssi]